MTTDGRTRQETANTRQRKAAVRPDAAHDHSFEAKTSKSDVQPIWRSVDTGRSPHQQLRPSLPLNVPQRRRRPTMHLLRRLSRRKDAQLRRGPVHSKAIWKATVEGECGRQIRTYHRLRQPSKQVTHASSAPTPATIGVYSRQ